MSKKFQSRGFMERVGSQRDSTAICDYLNSEVDRHIKSLFESVEKNKAKLDAEKTKKRRQAREVRKLNLKMMSNERSKRINAG